MSALSITAGSISAGPGEKTEGSVLIPGTSISMPVTLINGGEGKTVLITAGIHGCEYPGILAASELARELAPDGLNGRLMIVHPVNPQAFFARVPAVVPEDGKNINRVFPGDRDGTAAEKTAYFLTDCFQSRADFYMDLHSGDLHESLVPYVYYPGAASADVVAQSRAAARVLDMKYMVKSSALTGAYNSAAARGTPSILIERGGGGKWSREEVDAYKKDVRNVLRHLGLLGGSAEPAENTPGELSGAVYLSAKRGGCWYPAVRAGERLEKNRKLGEVKDFFGNTLDTYYSESGGVVLYMTVSLAVRERGSLIAYGKFADGA